MFKRLFKNRFKMGYRKLSKEETIQKGYTTRGQSIPNIDSKDFIGTWTNKKRHVVRVIGVDVGQTGFYLTLSDGSKKSAKIIEEFKLWRLKNDPNYVVSLMDYDGVIDDDGGFDIPENNGFEKFRNSPPKIDNSAFKNRDRKDVVPKNEEKEITPTQEIPKEINPPKQEPKIMHQPKPQSPEKQLLSNFFDKKKKTTTYSITVDLPVDKMMLMMLLDMEGVSLDLVCETLAEKITSEKLEESIKSILVNFIDPSDDVEVED